MYVFRIVSRIDSSKAWYKGDVMVVPSVTVTDPAGYPPFGSTAAHTGDSVSNADGFIYTSLKDENGDDPAYNYAGYPAEGNSSWLRSGYANKVRMYIPEAGGITESFGADISGLLNIPVGTAPNGLVYDVDRCSCCLFSGILGSAFSVSSAWTGRTHTATDLDSIVDGDYAETSIGNPETSGLNKAFTLSDYSFPYNSSFSFTITKSSTAASTYCSGAYLGSWSYLGKTQWTGHKKGINDYSRNEQDGFGNYALSKRRTGRTYSAEVILKTRDTAVIGDYDYDIEDLCYSVLELLRSLMGTVNAFYFSNQDLGIPWVPHNNPDYPTLYGSSGLRNLNESDLIVGVLKSFSITNIQEDNAVLNISVDSVPNQYQNYLEPSDELPDTAPTVSGVVACTSISFSATDLSIGVGVTDTSVSLVIDPVDGTYDVTGSSYGTAGVCTVTLDGLTLSITGDSAGTSTVIFNVAYWSTDNKVKITAITLNVTVT